MPTTPKILFVCPEFPESFWSFRTALRFVGKRAAFPPLGLLTVAALAPQHWPKRLVDMNANHLRDSDLDWADLVFVTGMTQQRDAVRAVIARCKERGLVVVGGGPLFSTEPESFPEVDYLVLNEAEVTLPGFLKDWEAGCPRRVYSSEDFCDMRSSPIPAWELVDLRAYGSASIQFSRGCPFRCEFCNVTSLFGHRPRTKSVGQVLAELDLLAKLGWHGKVFFVDDNFIGNRAQVKRDLLPALIDWQNRHGGLFPLYTQASIDLADDPELLGLMREAGFESVFIGVETPSEESLQECTKRQNQGRDLLGDIHKIQAAGIEVQAGFIVGFDSDPPSIFRRQIQFIEKSGIPVAMVGVLQAVKGTRLYRRLAAEGRLLGDTSGDNFAGATNFATVLDTDTLLAGHRTILDTIYAPQNYYRRLRQFLRRFRRPRIAETFSFKHIRAVLTATIALGVLGMQRFEYWKLLFWTACRKPSLLPCAISLAILGHDLDRACSVSACKSSARRVAPPRSSG